MFRYIFYVKQIGDFVNKMKFYFTLCAWVHTLAWINP